MPSIPVDHDPIELDLAMAIIVVENWFLSQIKHLDW